jgi:hypothetical protein
MKTLLSFSKLVFFFSLLTFLSTGSIVSAEHYPDLSWMAGYKDDKGNSCCGVYDCAEVEAKVLYQTPNSVVVKIEGVELELPQVRKPMWGKTHFHTHDQYAYWCFLAIDNHCDGLMGDANCLRPTSPVGIYSVNGTSSAPEITEENTICLFIPFGS